MSSSAFAGSAFQDRVDQCLERHANTHDTASVTLQCTAQGGKLSECKVVENSAPGRGFDKAALCVAESLPMGAKVGEIKIPTPPLWADRHIPETVSPNFESRGDLMPVWRFRLAQAAVVRLSYPQENAAHEAPFCNVARAVQHRRLGRLRDEGTSGGRGSRAPLRDFNLMQDAIPAALQRAILNPYDSHGLDNCESLLSAVGELDVVLGPDLDTPRESKRKDMYDKGASMAAQAALDAVKDTAEGVIPMKTWVRKLSGAASADIRAHRAIAAGM
eukprot:gene14716-14839_t